MTGLLLELRIAAMNLFEHRRRSSYLAAAIAAVTCLFVLLASLLVGIRETMVDKTTTLMTGQLNIGGYLKATSNHVLPVLPDAAQLSKVIGDALPEMHSMVLRERGVSNLIAEDGTAIPAALVGIEISSESRFKAQLDIMSGSVESLARPNTVVLFEEQAKSLNVRVGDSVTVAAATFDGSINTIECQVVAIARDAGIISRFPVYVPSVSLRELYGLPSDAIAVIQIQVGREHLDDLAALADRLRQALRRADYGVMEPEPQPYYVKLEEAAHDEWTGERLDVTTWEDEFAFMMWPIQLLRGVGSVLLGVLALIMMAGIVNTLWIAIRERTREIGTLRAIGMQRSGVARMFWLEAALLGLTAATIGSTAGAASIWLVNAAKLRVPLTVQLFLMSDSLRLAFEPSTLAWAITLTVLVTSIAALVPSVRAARRRPVEAMAHFG